MAFDREMDSYTAAELQRETGFDRRTIAYYVHEGLLPKVGRRGSRTRYPKLVRDRLALHSSRFGRRSREERWRRWRSETCARFSSTRRRS